MELDASTKARIVRHHTTPLAIAQVSIWLTAGSALTGLSVWKRQR